MQDHEMKSRGQKEIGANIGHTDFGAKQLDRN